MQDSHTKSTGKVGTTEIYEDRGQQKQRIACASARKIIKITTELRKSGYLGGERSGGKRGRGAPGKTPFVAAVQTNEQGHPLRMKLTVVEGFRLTEIAAWAQLHLGTGTRVVSDGLACFHGVTAAGCVHEPVVVGSGRAAVERPEFRWVNTILGNIKNALRGTYHAIRPKYAQRYLSEFEYRFNRRFDLPDIIPRLVYVALRTPPMPERLLKLRLA